MSDRVILAVKFTSAGAGAQVRKAVGGFLRYVQHRDLHPTLVESRPQARLSGLVKYVAYRDRASTRAELFGPNGTMSSADRKAFAAFVSNAIDSSPPQMFRGRDGEMHDRRRAVYRLVISPERADGLELRRLAIAAVNRLEKEANVTGLQWIAAIHRNTAHHHVHLVVAGMHQDSDGSYRRVDISRPRLAAMKEALAHEIELQRNERIPSRQALPARSQANASTAGQALGFGAQPWRAATSVPVRRNVWPRSVRHRGSVIALRAVARRYQRRMQRELEENYRRGQSENAA